MSTERTQGRRNRHGYSPSLGEHDPRLRQNAVGGRLSDDLAPGLKTDRYGRTAPRLGGPLFTNQQDEVDLRVDGTDLEVSPASPRAVRLRKGRHLKSGKDGLEVLHLPGDYAASQVLNDTELDGPNLKSAIDATGNESAVAGVLSTSGSAASPLSRAGHTHAHGAQTEPTHHAVATVSANGFMSSTDKAKLDTIPASFARTFALMGG